MKSRTILCLSTAVAAALATGITERSSGSSIARLSSNAVTPAVRKPPQTANQVTACSLSRDVCVHAPGDTPAPAIASALKGSERALATLASLGLPRPRPDLALGGGPALDVYLAGADAAPPPGGPHDEPTPRHATAFSDEHDGAAFAVASSFGWVPLFGAAPSLASSVEDDEVRLARGEGARAPSPLTTAASPRSRPTSLGSGAGALASRGCELERAAAVAAARASLFAVDAAAHGGVADAIARYLASLASPCAAVELHDTDVAQRSPERALVGEPEALRARAAGPLFAAFLEETYGTGAAGALPVALLAISSQLRETPSGSPAHLRHGDEPDFFDALRGTLKDRGRTLDGVLLDFAVSRAFLGTRSDGQHGADSARLGRFGRVHFEWNVPFTSLPRRLTPLRPVEPTGSTYLWLDMESAPPNWEVTFAADWELPPLFRWAIVKVDKSGAEVGRIEVSGVFGDSRAQRTVLRGENEPDLSGLLIVGVNVGSLDRSRPYDPDDTPVGHGYSVTLHKDL